ARDPGRELHRRPAPARGPVRRPGVQRPGVLPAGDDGAGRPLLAARGAAGRRLLPDRRPRPERRRRGGPGAPPPRDQAPGRGAGFEDDVRPAVDALRQANVDVVLCTGAYQGCGAFVRAARDAGWKVPISNVSFVGSDAMLRLLVTHGRARGKEYTRALINSQV